MHSHKKTLSSILCLVALALAAAPASAVQYANPRPTPRTPIVAGSHQQLFLDPANKYHLSWIKSDAGQEVTFTVTVKTRGWVGFGISPNGGMINSDIVIGWVDAESGGVHFHDRFAHGESLPVIDESQDWHLESGAENGTHTILVFSRPYKTCDDRDRDILDGVMRIIWAYGDEDPAEKNQIQIHHLSKRGSKSLRLLMDATVADEELESDIETWNILAKNSRVPDKETTYFCTLHKAPSGGKRHIVKYEAIVQPGNEQHVHHMVLFRCQHPDPRKLEVFLRQQDHECIPGLNNMPPDLLNCRAFYIIWTVGGGPFSFPKEAGLQFGSSDPSDTNALYYMLEIHYDNKYGVKNVVDNSGIRLYLTKKLRKYDADNYVMGSAEDYRIVLPPRQPELIVAGHCSPECHDDVMPDQGVTVMSIMVHAHLYATRIKARHFRGNVELEPLVDEKHYDFNYQDYWHYPEPRKILRGDQITVECYYNTTGEERAILGGFQTSEEMCHVFIAYYPRMADDRSCFSGLSPTTIATFAGIDELAPIIPEVDPVIVSPKALKGQNLTTYLQQKTDWNDELVTNALHLLRYAPRQTMCYYRPTERVRITEHMVGYPKDLVEWVEQRHCTAGYGAAVEGGGGLGWLAIAGIVAAVVVVGLAGWWCLRRGRRTESNASISFGRVG